MYPATFLVIAAVALMFSFWVGFLLWAWRSGQFYDQHELRRLPLEDDLPPNMEHQRHG
ncbi:MAG: cbb3-type cytochrome oxidase assembly protein CcoS [Candidatus Hydrogenedentes bacterium]|nr:cbb3-type cytochrome oxidase assembly protein CcoS [Candidatus Hydrogenedentota bacterium]